MNHSYEVFRSSAHNLVKAFGSRPAFWVVVALALACAGFLISQKLQPSDDAYITFRHVKNLLEHGRPAWNLGGEPVLGTTTPAFLLALAFFRKLLWLCEIDQAALYLNGVFHFAIVILAFLILKDLTRRTFPSILGALLVGLNAVAVYVFSEGFENAMLVAVLLAGLYCVRTGRDSLSATLASLAPLIRPEGILLTPLVWGYILARRRFRKRLLIAYFTLPLIWLAFSIPYYGSPIPHAIQAKKRFPSIYRPYTGDDVDLLRRVPKTLGSAVDLWKHPAGSLLLLGAASHDFETTPQTCRYWIMLLGLPLAVFCIVRRPDGRAIYLLYPLLFLLLYGWIGHAQPWYFPSFVIFGTLFLFTGWIGALRVLKAAIDPCGRGWVSRYKVVHVVTLALFVVFITVNKYSVNEGQFDHRHRGLLFPPNPWGPLWDMWEVQRSHYYRQAAEYVSAHAEGLAVAMISEVGVFGYLYAGDVIDTVGLCSPRALQFYPPPEWDIRDENGNFYTKANNFVPTEMVMTLKPDYVIDSQFYLFNLLHAGSPFLDEYEEMTRFGRIWGEPVLIFRRRQSDQSLP